METPTFSIKSSSSDFLNKQKNIFDLLTVVEKEVSSPKGTDPFQEVEHNSRKRKRNLTKSFRGKESLFKRPQEPPPKFRHSTNVPDFRRNPERWQKYTLADVTQDELSEESNTATAMAFLKTLKKEENIEIKMEVDDYVERKFSNVASSVKFNHDHATHFAEALKRFADDPDEKPVFKNSKLVMPEYVVGQVKKEKKIKSKITVETGKEVHLGHLHEYEDE